jgi:hypothetical protein
MQNLLLEVKSIRRCEGGHTCNLISNGKKVAFIGPDIFEWTSYSKKVDVLTWYASKGALKAAELKPVELKQGWESQIADHKLDDARQDLTEAALHEWIEMHFLAFELVQRCKNVLMTLGYKGEILDWGIPPGNATDTLKRVAADRFSSKLLNGLSIAELVKILEVRRKTNKSTTAVKV